MGALQRWALTGGKIGSAAMLVACAPVPPPSASAQPAPLASENRMSPAFAHQPLPYATTALEPVIDAETMAIHHGRHHKAYVDNLNRAVAADPALQGLSQEAMFARMSTLSAAVRNNGGGDWNHRFFWASMAAPGSGGAPSGALAAAIDRDFGSFAAMQAAFDAAGAGRFGSGWVWLIQRADGKLAIASTPNQDNPLMDVADMRGKPLLGNDVWEHAYYLKYQNRRADYLKAWWQVVNWQRVSDRFAAREAAVI